MVELTDDRLLDLLVRDAQVVADLDEAALVAPVPWCGDWRVGDVVGHLGGVQRWATALSTEPGTWFKRREMAPPPTGPAVLAWFADGIGPMREAFHDTDLSVTVKSWAGDVSRRWWLRRLAHETAVHRWDATAAAAPDTAAPIEVDLAVDGIDELFECFLPLFANGLAGHGTTMHLHATDAVGEWLVTSTDDGVTVVHEHAKGDVAVRAPASELLLLLWNRRTLVDLDGEVFGDTAVLDRWRDVARA